MAVAQFVGVPVPQIMEDFVDGVQAALQELVPNRLGEQIGAVPVIKPRRTSSANESWSRSGVCRR